ncbi:MAG: hypothetical protein IMY73_04735 [Bacteroidetes bacterium]|nr:hypothetical protein [Bacteroidota bacterium]
MKKLHYLTATLLLSLLCNVSIGQTTDSTNTTTFVNAKKATPKGVINEYRRSSLYSVLLEHPKLKYGETIDSVFLSIPTPDKFNSHDLAVKSFESTAKKSKRRGKAKEKANAIDINKFINEKHIAKDLVAKWFNRKDSDGTFGMDLIYERGYYDASSQSIKKADNSLLGKAVLADAGEDLIGKTFLLVNDITFIDHGENSAKASKYLKMFGEFASAATGDDSYQEIANTTGDVVNEIDGFALNITSYLYCLEWNEEISATFYECLWQDESCPSPERKEAFDASDIFKLRYVGRTTTTAQNFASKNFSARTKKQQMSKTCTRAIDKSIVELQREYDEFKVNVPITQVNEDGTVNVPIGLKEGLNEKSVYDVMIATKNEENKTIYEKVGRIKPVKGKIWDNRFGALEDAEEDINGDDDEAKIGNAKLTSSTFEITRGKNKIFSGCLTREVTIKRN